MVLTVTIRKGGTGKSSTAAAFAQCLTVHNKKTVLIDTDTQGSLTNLYDADPNKAGIYEAILERVPIMETVQHTRAGDIITPGRRLDRLQTTITKTTTNTMKQALKPLKAEFEHIIIDTPPRNDFMLEDCLNASDGVIIPVESDTSSFKGFRDIVRTVWSIQKESNKQLKIMAVIINRYNGRPSTLEKEYKKALEDYCQEMGIKTPFVVHNGIAVREAAALCCNLYEYKPKSRPAEDFKSILKDLKMI